MLKNKWFQFSLALFVIPLVLNLVFYNQLPDVVPTHFDVNGQVDGTMPKFMGLFGMLFLCLAIHVFTCFVTVKDPKRNNIPDFMMNILFMICPFVCIVTNMTIIYFGLLSVNNYLVQSIQLQLKYSSQNQHQKNSPNQNK